MDTKMHVRGPLEALVIEADVCIEEVFCAASVLLVILPARKHLLGAEVWMYRQYDLKSIYKTLDW